MDDVSGRPAPRPAELPRQRTARSERVVVPVPRPAVLSIPAQRSRG